MDAAYARIQADAVLAATYDRLLEALRETGEVRLEFRKSGVGVLRGETALVVRAHRQGLEIILPQPDLDTAAVGGEQPRPNEMLLTSPDDVTAELVQRLTTLLDGREVR